jgi:hypothetical protein
MTYRYQPQLLYPNGYGVNLSIQSDDENLMSTSKLKTYLLTSGSTLGKRVVFDLGSG